MTAIAEMIRGDALNEGKLEGKLEKAIEIAENALKEGAEIGFIKRITGLDEFTIKQLQSELKQ